MTSDHVTANAFVHFSPSSNSDAKNTRSNVNRIKGQLFMAVTALGHINAYLCPLSSDLKNILLLAKRLKKDQ